MTLFGKGLSLSILLISLNGCASFIAHEITHSKTSEVKGNISNLVVEKQSCDDTAYCIATMHVNPSVIAPASLDFNININEKHKVWRYKAQQDTAETSKPLANQLIILFAGYRQPTQLMYIHQKWLQQITGADVIVVPSAEKSAKFKFGLDYAAPLITEIQKLNPTKVHLIGFSMGALAAKAVEQQVDNARLYLFAPMLDFERSTKAIFDMQYRHKFYARFISQATLNDAIKIVYRKSDTTAKDINLLNQLDQTKSPTFVYTSNKDKVVDYSAFSTIKNQNIDVNIYDELNHAEIIALFSSELQVDFVSDLLERPVLASDIATLGILCDVDDHNCLQQLPD